jgi:CheY-like chemotaxis protein
MESAHYHVETASSEDAIHRMESGLQPDLILLDIAAPNLDDLRMIEACRRVRSDQKVVVMSQESDVSIVVRAMRAEIHVNSGPRFSSCLAQSPRLACCFERFC